MSERIVVDVGNTRIKWGLVQASEIVACVALPPDDITCWEQQLQLWPDSAKIPWTVTGVHPVRRKTLLAWLGSIKVSVHLLETYRDLPIQIALPAPERVGIDRLLNAVAANARRPIDSPAILIDAGSAITVDLVDEAGVFRGGSITPGIRLMTQALHERTALLPIVDIQPPIELPGTSTIEAIKAGVYHTVLGGIERLVRELSRAHTQLPCVYITGGDAELLKSGLDASIIHWPEMTLHGILNSEVGHER